MYITQENIFIMGMTAALNHGPEYAGRLVKGLAWINQYHLDARERRAVRLSKRRAWVRAARKNHRIALKGRMLG